MRRYLSSIGRPNFVILITLIAIVMAVGLTILLSKLQGIPTKADDVNRAIIIPIIIAPLISWYLVGLLFKLDKLEDKMNQLVIYDQLTGLMSRRAFFEGAEKSLSLAKRHQQTLSVLALDLDYFKRINDKYGHQAGDLVLTNLGELVKKIVRKSDFAGRIGGEEFSFILPKTDLEQARLVADKIQLAISEQAIKFKDDEICYSASIGISTLRTGHEISLEQLMHQADKALYRAKEEGRNRVISYPFTQLAEAVS